MRGIKSKARKSRKTSTVTLRKFRRRVLSVSQLLGKIRQQRQQKLEQQKRQKPVKPIIPPKSLIIIYSFIRIFYIYIYNYLKKPFSLLTNGNRPMILALLIVFAIYLCCLDVSLV